MTVLENVTASELLKLLTWNFNRKHKYFYQVQGQLNITGRNYCDFVVWTPKDMFIERIEKCVQFWEQEMLPHLITFYTNCLLPEIVDPRKHRSMEIRDWKPPERGEFLIACAFTTNPIQLIMYNNISRFWYSKEEEHCAICKVMHKIG